LAGDDLRATDKSTGGPDTSRRTLTLSTGLCFLVA